MPSIQHAFQVALALSVEPKGKGSSQTSNGGGGGGSCYDSDGNLITCPLSKTESIVIGLIAGIVVLVLIASTICCVVRNRRQRRLASNKNDRMGAHQQVPSEDPYLHEQAIPYDPHKEQLEEMGEDEKPLHSTLYDPLYPTQQDGHQFSDSASIASSVYNLSPATPAQPQDYSYQYYYNTDLTAPPRMYAPPSHHPSTPRHLPHCAID